MSDTLFGTTSRGQPVRRLGIGAGALRVHVLTWGAVLHGVTLQGHPRNLTLAVPEFAAYENTMQYYGAVVGPVANRIAQARAPIAGKMHHFEINENAHTLHSGSTGVHAQLWDVRHHDETSLTLALDLADGRGGFPGARHLEITYRVDPPARLTTTITATTDAATLMNLTGHHYWNLGHGDDFAGHVLQIFAEQMLELDDELIPTGEIHDVAGSDHDFRAGRVLAPGAPPLDRNFCLPGGRADLRPAGRLSVPGGVAMLLETTEPGLQVYDARASAEAGFAPFAGVALEAQGWPDAPNQPGFISIALAPGDTYRQVTRLTFSRSDAPG
jgi:aldose 1-epimerase